MKRSNRFVRENVITYFGTQSDTARYFGIERQAVHAWKKGEDIPEKFRLRLMLNIPKDFPAH